MAEDYATDPRLRRFCRDHGLSAGAIAQLAALVESLVVEQGNLTLDTFGVLDAMGAPPLPAPPDLADRYEDIGRIGAGATGDVRRVRERRMGRVLAMKILHRALLGHPGALGRFQREATLTAMLHHPGVVVVHDQGTTDDGRPWFTMQEVRGRTFRAVLASREWSMRRAIDAFARAAQAVAYAHDRGVIHRDIKPDNIMIGAFGVVQVMDWGLACRVGDLDAGMPVLPGEGLTQAGAVLGTPGYMAPEVAAGSARGAKAGDVYALGAVLYHLLAGRAPYPSGGPEPWRRVLEGSPAPLVDVPEELAELAGHAMARSAEARPSAEALAEGALAWLDGDRRRAQAQELLEGTLARLPELEAIQRQGAAAREAAAALIRQPAARQAGFALEAEAVELARRAALLEAEIEHELHAALNLDAANRVAHTRLADLYQARMSRAEARGDVEAASMGEVLLRAHDQGRHAAWLTGEGWLDLETHPSGARIQLHSYLERDRRLVLGPGKDLGTTPLRSARIPHGSQLLVVEAPGHAPMRLPVAPGRLERWEGGGVQPLLPLGLASDACYVPAGWFVCGGDPDAADGLPARRLWVDGFVIQRFPVRQSEWLAFINRLAAAGEEVEDLLPRTKTDGCPIYRLGPAGWEAGPDDRGEIWAPDLPITQISWHAARRYCAAQPPLLGAPWRLPDEVEWEKAARGVDGRIWPWGHHFEPAEICMSTMAGSPRRVAVDAFPDDESPYGVRGMAGNVRDLCSNAWTADGDLPEAHLVPRTAAPDAAHVVLRGGNWYSAAAFCRPANRLVLQPGDWNAGAGFRMVASFPGP